MFQVEGEKARSILSFVDGAEHMTPVTSISAVTAERGQHSGRLPEGPRVPERGGSEINQGSRIERQLRDAGADEETVASLRANLAALFADTPYSSPQRAELHEKVEAVLKQHGVDLDHSNGANHFANYGKVVEATGAGDIRLLDPPAKGSLRQLLQAVEDSRGGPEDPPSSKTDETLQALLGVDITV
jgi:hypothetical protein